MQVLHQRRSRATAVGIILTVVLAATGLSAGTASAASPYEKGPAPTNASLEASSGPFAVANVSVPASVAGFAGGTIYYPTTTTVGTFGAVAVAPGFTNTQSAVSWYGPRFASHGFVIFTINTDSRYDFPSSRADQLQAALNYLVSSSSVRTRIDPNRLGVMGYSMGGGGAIEAARDNRSLKAAIGLAPWHSTKSWSTVTVPTMVMGMESDSVAPVGSHSIPFYTSLPSTTEKAYLELNNAGHSAPTSSNTTIAKYGISWLKRWIDEDTRYTQFLCPGPATGTAVSQYRNTCPM